jgi:hypothetical protein
MSARKIFTAIFNLLRNPIPADVKAIFDEAHRRATEDAKRRTAADPNWRDNTFDGPESHVGLAHYIEQVAAEHGVDVKKWAEELAKES